MNMSTNQINPAVQLRSETAKLPVIRVLIVFGLRLFIVLKFCPLLLSKTSVTARMPSTSMTSVTFEGQRYGAGNWMSGYQRGRILQVFQHRSDLNGAFLTVF